jgi:hypothetical protein
MTIQENCKRCEWLQTYKARIRKNKYATYLSIDIRLARKAKFQSGDKLVLYRGSEMGRPILVYYLDKQKHAPPKIENCEWLEDYESYIRTRKATFYISIERGIATKFRFNHGDRIYYYIGLDEKRRYLVKIYMDKKDELGEVGNGNQKDVSINRS